MSTYSSEIVLKENLRALRLPTILREYDACSRAAIENSSSYLDFLSALTTLEVNERAIKRIKRRISEAQFPALKTLDSFDMNKAPALSSHKVKELAECKYINQGENIIDCHCFIVLVLDLHLPDHHAGGAFLIRACGLADFLLGGQTHLDGVADANRFDKTQIFQTVIGQHWTGCRVDEHTGSG